MLFAVFTALCWALGGFASSRIARHYGPAPANGLRLTLAAGCLALICLLAGAGLVLPAWRWFAASGILHLTIGDLALFGAYRRLGPRLGVLMVCSLAPPTALLAEWSTLGTTVSGPQLVCAAGILVSVALAVAPRERAHLSPPELRLGLWFGLLAAVGQGLGAAVNRIAYDRLGGLDVSAWLPAFYRVGAAALGVGLWLLALRAAGKTPPRRPGELIPHKRVGGHPVAWLAGSALFGPVLGMMFLMRAFATAPAGLVQATLSTLPVFMMPVAWLLDGNAPSRRSALAGIAAVGWTALLMLV